MKPAIVTTNTTRTTVGTQDITDASVTSDLVAFMPLMTHATATNTLTAKGQLSFGCTDLTNSIAGACGIQDATAGATAKSYGTNVNCLAHTVAGSGADVLATYSSTLSNGVRLNYGNVNGTAYAFGSLLISGSDIAVKVASQVFLATDTVKTITHGHPSAPSAFIIRVQNGAVAVPATSDLCELIGFWDGTNSVGASFNHNTGSNPTAVSARIIGTDLGRSIRANGERFTVTVGNVTATTLDITFSAASTAGAIVEIISFRPLSGSFAAAAGITTLPTGTGNSTFISGMAVKPQLLFTVSTRLTGTTLDSTDAAGSFGIGVACNNAGSTQQMAVALTSQDNVATSVAKCRTDDSTAVMVLDNTGAVDFAATIQSWDSGGVTINTSNAGASAFETIYLAMGLTSSSSGTSRGGLGGGFSDLSGGFRG